MTVKDNPSKKKTAYVDQVVMKNSDHETTREERLLLEEKEGMSSSNMKTL